jgi:hypothetical protein
LIPLSFRVLFVSKGFRMHMRWCERRKAKGDQKARENKEEFFFVASADDEADEDEEEDVDEDDEDGGEEDGGGDENEGDDRDEEDEDDDEEEDEDGDESNGSVESGDDHDPLPSSLSSSDGPIVHALLQPLALSASSKGAHPCVDET